MSTKPWSNNLSRDWLEHYRQSFETNSMTICRRRRRSRSRRQLMIIIIKFIMRNKNKRERERKKKKDYRFETCLQFSPLISFNAKALETNAEKEWTSLDNNVRTHTKHEAWATWHEIKSIQEGRGVEIARMREWVRGWGNAMQLKRSNKSNSNTTVETTQTRRTRRISTFLSLILHRKDTQHTKLVKNEQ